jgi:hypothetical protein
MKLTSGRKILGIGKICMINYIIPHFTTEATPHRLENLKICVENCNDCGVVPIIISNMDPDLPYEYEYLNVQMEYFNKCRILNEAVSQIDGRFFLLDSDIIFPSYFPELVDNIVDDNTSYFPICYRLNKNKPRIIFGDYRARDYEITNYHGSWVTGGFGLCGMSKINWVPLPEDIGESWGQEDEWLYASLSSKTAIVRHKVIGLFHIWHPTTPFYKHLNYKEKIPSYGF